MAIDNDQAQIILDTIKRSKKILLHCHPFSDPDSVGSVLAMNIVLKNMGKDVVSIGGDTELPNKFDNLPHREWILPKNYTEIDLEEFDLFIILDSSSVTQITQIEEVKFPKELNTIVIDHHASNTKYGKLNLIDGSHSSTSQILYDLFVSWGVAIDSKIAACLLVGIFGDTGGFKNQNTNSEAFLVASKLSKICPDYHKFILGLDTRKPVEIEMMGLALSSIEKYCSERVAFSLIGFNEIKKRRFSKEQALEGLVADILKSVEGWDLVASLVEAQSGIVTVSLRTRNENIYDVSKIAQKIGENGGGHKGAAGTTIYGHLEYAKDALLTIIIETFPQLKQLGPS